MRARDIKVNKKFSCRKETVQLLRGVSLGQNIIKLEEDILHRTL